MNNEGINCFQTKKCHFKCFCKLPWNFGKCAKIPWRKFPGHPNSSSGMWIMLGEGGIVCEHSHWGWQVARHGVILFWNSSRTYYEVPDFSGSSCIIISRCIDINIFKGFRIIVQDSFFSIQLSYFSINVQLKIEFPLKYYLTSDYLLGVYLPQFPFVLFEICTIYFLQTPADRTKRCPASRCWWSGGRCCPGSRWTERAVSGQSRSSSPLHSPIWRPPESSQTLKRNLLSLSHLFRNQDPSTQ